MSLTQCKKNKVPNTFRGILFFYTNGNFIGLTRTTFFHFTVINFYDEKHFVEQRVSYGISG